jgi:Protein of unknown function (DUF2934)
MQREGKPSPAYPHAGPVTALAGLFLWSGASVKIRSSCRHSGGVPKRSPGAVMRRTRHFASRCLPAIVPKRQILPFVNYGERSRTLHHQPRRTSHMDRSLEIRIRERAYEIWTEHGCVDGQAQQHWLAAEREVLAASTAVLAGKPNPNKKPRSSARSKAARTLARAG